MTKSNKDTVQKLNDQLDFVNRENHWLEGELETAKASLKEVDGFMKDRKNMSANLVELDSKNKLLQQELKQMDSVIKVLKRERNENSDPNEQIELRTVPLIELIKEQ